MDSSYSNEALDKAKSATGLYFNDSCSLSIYVNINHTNSTLMIFNMILEKTP